MNELSVIMATYNEAPNFLKICMDSILQQTFKDFEFIIVAEPDEKNIDYLTGVANIDHRVKVLKNKARLGVSGSRNRAIEESSGDYVAIIDSDDYCDPDRFGKQLLFLKGNPEISVVGSNMYLVDAADRVVGERRYPELHGGIKKYFLVTMAIANPTVMVRKKDLEKIGLFNGNFSKAEDFELWLRFLVNGKKMHNLQESLLYYRVQPGHNMKRGRVHWRNLYMARKKYSRFIWPFYQRFPSIFFCFILSLLPDSFMDILLNPKAINRMKNIKLR